MIDIDNDIYYWTHMLDESFSVNEAEEFNDFFKSENIDGKNIIDCSNKNLQQLPSGCQEQVGTDLCKVSFDCSNNQLKNLIGSPKIVYGNFDCSSNPLTSLEGCPTEIYGDLIISDCSQLTSLDHAPTIVTGIIFATNCGLKTLHGCPKECESLIVFRNELTSLNDSPEIIKDTFNCSINPITSLQGCVKQTRDFICNDCCLKTLIDGPIVVKGTFNISGNQQLTTLRGAPCKVGHLMIKGTSINGVQADVYLNAVEQYEQLQKYQIDHDRNPWTNSLCMIDGHYDPIVDNKEVSVEDHISRSKALRNAILGTGQLRDPFKTDSIKKSIEEFRKYRLAHPPED